MSPPQPVRLRTTAVIAAAAVPIAWVVGRAWYPRLGAIPVGPWATIGLGCLALGLVLMARLDLRRSPRGATALLALSQASMIVGALAAGWNAGLALVLAGDLDVGSVRGDAGALAATAIAAAALCVAGWQGQERCRIRS